MFIQTNFTTLLKDDIHNGIVFMNELRTDKPVKSPVKSPITTQTISQLLQRINNNDTTTTETIEQTPVIINEKTFPLLHHYKVTEDKTIINNLLMELIRYKQDRNCANVVLKYKTNCSYCTQSN